MRKIWMACVVMMGVCLMMATAAADAALLPGARFYGGSDNDTLRCALPLQAGGHLLLGQTTSSEGDIGLRYSRSQTYGDAWALCLDAQGEKRWDALLGERKTYDQFIAGGYVGPGEIALLQETMDEEQIRYAAVTIRESDGVVMQTKALPIAEGRFYACGENLLCLAGQGGRTAVTLYTWSGELLWENLLEAGVEILGVKPKGDAICLYGKRAADEIEAAYAYAAQLDTQGSILWETQREETLLAGSFYGGCGTASAGTVAVGVRTTEGGDRPVAVSLDAQGVVQWQTETSATDTVLLDAVRGNAGYTLVGQHTNWTQGDYGLQSAYWLTLDEAGNILHEERVAPDLWCSFEVRGAIKTAMGRRWPLAMCSHQGKPSLAKVVPTWSGCRS